MQNKDVLIIKQIKERILPILAKHNIHEVYLFGSYARGDANNKSDVDIIFIGSTLDDYFLEQLEKDKICIF